MKIKTYLSFLSGAILLAQAQVGSAGLTRTVSLIEIWDFATMADNAYGESAYEALELTFPGGFTMTVTAANNEYVYLDAGSAGMGVCSALQSGASVGQRSGQKSNICEDSSDDNVSFNAGADAEELVFSFEPPAAEAGWRWTSWNVKFEQIWFNNSHDTSGSNDGDVLDNTVMINNERVTLTKGNGWVLKDAENYYGGGAVSPSVDQDSGPVTIAYDNNDDRFGNPDQFYLSGMNLQFAGRITQIPTASVVALWGIGLLAMVGTLRRRRAA